MNIQENGSFKDSKYLWLLSFSMKTILNSLLIGFELFTISWTSCRYYSNKKREFILISPNNSEPISNNSIQLESISKDLKNFHKSEFDRFFELHYWFILAEY